MGPIDTGIALAIDAYILDQALPAAGAAGLIKDVLSQYEPKSPKTSWLRHVVGVEPTNNASLLKAPRNSHLN